MNTTQLFQDISLIQDHIHMSQSTEKMKQWVGFENDDFQIPSAAIIHLLLAALIPTEPDRIQLRTGPRYQTIVNIMNNSSLREILHYDEKLNCISFSEEVPLSLRMEIGRFVATRNKGIGN